MANYTLENSVLSIILNEAGAELTSIIKIPDNSQYLWNGNPLYWKRHSPILFPIVGSLKNQSYTHEGKTYSMSQHGFARDMDFVLEDKTDNSILFSLSATKETKEVYPFSFKLDIGYKLIENQIEVSFKVINTDNKTIYFSIGAHPAFLCPLKEHEEQTDYFIGFDTKNPIHYILVNEQGFAFKQPVKDQKVLNTRDGLLSITPNLFDHDALIIENNQCQTISLLDAKQNPYVSVKFDAPLFGLWSPAGKKAPFICIEPWYGRCDASDFDGDLKDREWGNVLEVGQVFEASYTIQIN
ncbi:MAG: Aldose 1-epimerase [Anaerocolumna sp.]|jgi:galactose mutarotase-like enzyme|nr:Aldose 1-epimerase [Anaerocolumna sp.]